MIYGSVWFMEEKTKADIIVLASFDISVYQYSGHHVLLAIIEQGW
jgi:hypothetical protein